jgi:hypothetical protein
MNNFYVIAEEGKEVNEFDIPYFGGTVGQNQVSLAGGSIDIKRVNKPASSRDYDVKFRAFMYSIKPVYKVPQFLDYHLGKYQGDPNEFIYQIKYVILPQVERGNRPSYSKMIQDWLNSKNPKTESASYVINTGNVSAPIQIQQNSNHSIQTQNIKYSKENLSDLFELIRKDIEKLDKEIREDFEMEMNYAVKQLSKDNDIKPQLFNLGTLIKDVGLPIFTGLTSSGLFELIKPFIG